MSNEEILNKLKENINLQIGNFIYLMNEPLDRDITFKTGDNNVSLSPITRLPNNNEINDYLYNRVLNGMKIRINANYDFVFLTHNNELVGIYEKDQSYSEDNKSYKAKRVWK